MVAIEPSQTMPNATAFLIMNTDGEPTLCPFFGKCDGLVVVEPGSFRREFSANTERTAKDMCALIVESGARRLVLGFVPDAIAKKLRDVGVDIRLGSCACGIDELAMRFEDLPTL